VPTYERTAQFDRDFAGLSAEAKKLFRDAARKFVEDLEQLPPGQFRKSLRVFPMKGAPGIWEMTFDGNDGRATFQFGDEITGGDPHVMWRRVGKHSIYANP